MSLTRKLKPDRNITGAAVPLSMLPIFGLSVLIFNIETAMLILAAMTWAFGLYYLYVFARTGNRPHLFVAIYAALLGFLFYSSPFPITGQEENPEWPVAYMTVVVFFGAGLIYLTATRRLKWRGREIFELAAEPVEDTGDGYTNRPRPVGRVEYRPEQMRSFARFASSNLIGVPFRTSKNITLVLVKMGDEYKRLLGLGGDYLDASWINFDFNGEVSVHIAQQDYLDYRQPLVFDQLCNSLGQVFIDFFDLFVRGEGVRAIDRMDDLKISVFS